MGDMHSVFRKRQSFKPFEYPEVMKYKDAIVHSFWRVSHWDFVADSHDFRVRLDLPHRDVIKKALLAISQVEVAVKRFWARIGDRFPKAEFEQVGVTFAECEVRHADAYSHLLSVLGIEGEFGSLLAVPAVKARADHMDSVLSGAASCPHEDFASVLAGFSLFVENVALFAQFLVIKSFNFHTTMLKDIENVIQATQKEEQIHALFGVYLLGEMKKENPSWFGPAFAAKLKAAARRAESAECAVIDWMFSSGDLPFLKASQVKSFVRERFNSSLAQLGVGPAFAPGEVGDLAGTRWFGTDSDANTSTDFFHKTPVTYSIDQQVITAEELF